MVRKSVIALVGLASTLTVLISLLRKLHRLGRSTIALKDDGNILPRLLRCLGGAPPAFYEATYGRSAGLGLKRCFAKLSGGEVVGVVLPSGILNLRGVPFAEAGRLETPRPTPAWIGSKDCTRFGPVVPQDSMGTRQFFVSPADIKWETRFPPLGEGRSYTWGCYDEAACLNLNVYTPGFDGKRRAVIFWIHGGKFITGSNNDCGIYDGERLSSRGDVVVVTANYRFGAFSANVPGEAQNLSLRDLIAGLQWVNREIAAVGGDPSNVTIIGESAGGTAVLNLLASPATKGLFHKAVSSSGWAFSLTDEYVNKMRDALCSSLGASELTGEVVRSATVPQLIEATGKMDGTAADGMPGCGPVRDGEIVDADGAQAALGKGVNSNVPLLVGCMRDELAIIYAAFGETLGAQILSGPHLIREGLKISDCALNRTSELSLDERTEALLSEVRQALAAGPDAKEPPPALVWLKAAEAAYYRPLTYAAAAAHAKAGGSTFFFEFAAPMPTTNGRTPHGTDVFFLWPCFTGEFRRFFSEYAGFTYPLPDELTRFADEWQDAHVAFAKTGVPSGIGGTAWEPFPKMFKASPTGCMIAEAPMEGMSGGIQ